VQTAAAVPARAKLGRGPGLRVKRHPKLKLSESRQLPKSGSRTLVPNGRTLSEVPRQKIPTEAPRARAGALSIGPFERSRGRLRRMRQGYGGPMVCWRLGASVLVDYRT
jgi:hypothetical protein